MNETHLLTTAEVAKRLGRSPRTIARWVESGDLTPAVTLPGPRGAFLFAPDVVEAKAVQSQQTPEVAA